MRITVLFGLCTLGMFPALAGAQQAAMPTPPKTVNPLPQSTTNCRGCSDDNAVVNKSIGSYDTSADSTKRKPAAAPRTVSAKTHVTALKAKPSVKKHVRRAHRRAPLKHPVNAKLDTANKK